MSAKNTKNIIEGFEDDFEETVKGFLISSHELKLIDFFKYWTNNSMDCLFANRFDPRELFESISEINKLLVQILTDSSLQDDRQKIVALYFLLCVYVKQPERLRRKIRISCDDLICIEILLSKPEYMISDAKFAWKQLKSMQAIDFVEERMIYGPSLLTNKGVKSLCNPTTSSDPVEQLRKDTTEFLENKIEPALLAIEGICTSYDQIKESLRLDDYKDPTAEMKTGRTMREFIDQAKNLLLEFKTK